MEPGRVDVYPRIDRIDQLDDGRTLLLDYKSGEGEREPLVRRRPARGAADAVVLRPRSAGARRDELRAP